MRHRVKTLLSGGSRSRRRVAHAALLGVSLSTLVIALDAPDAFARETGKPGQRQNGQPVLFSADEVNYDDQFGLVIARGSVEISQGGRTLLADTVSYNQRTDTVTASGHVSMIQDTGDVVFGNYMELTDSLREGFIKDIRILMADRSRLAGNTGRRTDANRTEIRRGVYSPCDLCIDDPNAPPLWQLKAATIVHDKEKQVVEYENVSLEMGGVPVLWSPYFSHPDPSVKRASGFLPPSIGSSNTLGFNFDAPYYWVLGPDKDLTFAPLFTTKQGVDLVGQYRQRFGDGFIDTRASITRADIVSGTAGAPTTSHDQIRGHILSTGEFDLDDNWRTGWDVRRTTDQTYERLYHFGGTENFLTSDAYAEDFDGRNYGSVYTYAFQSLRLGVSDHSQPYVLPLGGYNWDFKPTDWGGHFTANINAADLVRETGPSSRRISAGGEYNQPWTTSDGSAFNFVAGIRADGYSIGNQPILGTGVVTASSAPFATRQQIENGSTGRVFPQIGLEWKDPFVRRGAHSTTVITPRAAIYAAPIGENPPQIPNDDSVSFDFNENDLFVRNRLVGYDQVDSGQRVDYGLQLDWNDDQGAKIRALVGASHRFQHQTPFNYGLGLDPVTNGAYQPTVAINSGTGVNREDSDYVGRILYSPSNFFEAGYRFRFDHEDLRPEHQELGISVGPGWLRLNSSYLQLGDNPRDGETHRQEVSFSASYIFNEYWRFTGGITRELSGDNSNQVSSNIGAQYEDECLTFAVSLSQTGIRDRDIKPGTTLLFQFVFKNLGEIALPPLATGSS